MITDTCPSCLARDIAPAESRTRGASHTARLAEEAGIEVRRWTA